MVKGYTQNYGLFPAARSGYAAAIIEVLFAHLLILESPDCHQNVVSSSFYYPGLLLRMSVGSIHSFLSTTVAYKETKAN